MTPAYTISEKNGKLIKLPGRDWNMLVGPDMTGSKNLLFGVAVFPPDSDAGPHVHQREEEVIYILSGHGQIKIGDSLEPLEPGVAAYIPPGIEHQVIVQGDQPLKLVTVFSPPVVPGSYDRR